MLNVRIRQTTRRLPLALAWLAVVTGGAIVGCRRSAPESEPAPAGAQAAAPAVKPLRIAMIAKSSTNPIFLSARRGAETAARTRSRRLRCPPHEVTPAAATSRDQDGGDG